MIDSGNTLTLAARTLEEKGAKCACILPWPCHQPVKTSAILPDSTRRMDTEVKVGLLTKIVTISIRNGWVHFFFRPHHHRHAVFWWMECRMIWRLGNEQCALKLWNEYISELRSLVAGLWSRCFSLQYHTRKWVNCSLSLIGIYFWRREAGKF